MARVLHRYNFKRPSSFLGNFKGHSAALNLWCKDLYLPLINKELLKNIFYPVPRVKFDITRAAERPAERHTKEESLKIMESLVHEKEKSLRSIESVEYLESDTRKG